MDKKITLPFALALVAASIAGCSSKYKIKDPKPTPLVKLDKSAKTLSPVFSQQVTATDKADPLRLQLASDQGVNFIVNPKGEVAAYKGKQQLWKSKVSKLGLTSGVVAAQGTVVVGNAKGQLFALDQQTGQKKWQAQLSGALISPSLIQDGRVVTIANDGTVFANDLNDGQQLWAYKLPYVQFSLRGQPSPILISPRTVLVSSANAYVYAIDLISGVPVFQRRVAVSEGRTDSQRLIDIDGDPVAIGQLLVTASYQGQVTVLDMSSQEVIWSTDASTNKRPEITKSNIFVSQADGALTAYDLNTGKKSWQNEELLHRQLSNPVMLGDYLIVGDLDGYLHMIDPTTGKIIGRARTSDGVLNLRVVDNQLYVATRKGRFSIWQNQ